MCPVPPGDRAHLPLRDPPHPGRRFRTSLPCPLEGLGRNRHPHHTPEVAQGVSGGQIRRVSFIQESQDLRRQRIPIPMALQAGLGHKEGPVISHLSRGQLLDEVGRRLALSKDDILEMAKGRFFAGIGSVAHERRASPARPGGGIAGPR